MTSTLLLKELRGLLRGGRFPALALCALVLLAASAFLSARSAQLAMQEKAAVQQEVRRQWDHQGHKHPHRGAHYGVYAFNPAGPLAAFDPGVVPQAGQAIWLEPHRRNMARFTPAADALPSSRFGEFTPALVLVTLVPLLLFAFAFDALSRERESGTLRMLHGAGVRPWPLAAAKVLAVVAVCCGMAVCAGAAGFAMAGWPGVGADAALRGALLAGAYVVFLTCLAAIALAVSALARTSAAALFVLLAAWVAFCFVVPRAGAAVASAAVPLPTPAAFWGAIHHDYSHGLPGDGNLAARGKRVDAELLSRYGVARIENLPAGAAALRRLARDAYADRVHALHFGRLWDAFERQERVLRAASALSPVAAMRAVSMKLAGTDLSHQRHFEESAEAYRQAINRQVDEWDAANSRGLTSFESKYADDAVWRAVPPFRYTAPGAAFAVCQALPDLAVLASWLAASLLALRLATRRLEP